MSDQLYEETPTCIPNFCLPNNIPSETNPNIEIEENNHLGNTDKVSLVEDQNQEASSATPYPRILQHLNDFDPKIQEEFSSLLGESSRVNAINLILFDEKRSLRLDNKILKQASNQNKTLFHTNKDDRTTIVNNQFILASSSKDTNPSQHERSPLPVSSVRTNQTFNNNDNMNVSAHEIGFNHTPLMETPKQQVLSSSNTLCLYCECVHNESPTSIMRVGRNEPSPLIRNNSKSCPLIGFEEYSKQQLNKSPQTHKEEKLLWEVSKNTRSPVLNKLKETANKIRDDSRDKRKSISEKGNGMENDLYIYRRSHMIQLSFIAINKLECLLMSKNEKTAELELENVKLKRKLSGKELEESRKENKNRKIAENNVTASEIDVRANTRKHWLDDEPTWLDNVPEVTGNPLLDQHDISCIDNLMEIDDDTNGYAYRGCSD